MSKKRSLTAIDFDFGVGAIIPANKEAYHNNELNEQIRKTEKGDLIQFKNTLSLDLDSKLQNNEYFPSDGEIFVFIIQYFASDKEYGRRDVDNMAKTILDVLKKRFYSDDSQVKTLLVGKKLEKRVPQNFAYVAIKKLSASQDVDALKISGLERSVIMFQELKSKKVL